MSEVQKRIRLAKLAGSGFKKYKNADYDLTVDIMKEEPLEALEQELMD